MFSRKFVISLLLSSMLALSLASFGSVQTPEAELDRNKRATVFIYQAQAVSNDLIVKCVSTGTIISADGLIITNAHSVVRNSVCDGDSLIVSLNVNLNEPPIPKFRAEIATADAGLDIALLKITRELDGRLIAAGSLPLLPFVEIGNANTVSIDDNIVVAGYRDVGNRAVAVTRGTVTAFIAEPRGGGRTWFKTRAEIPGTMSGGGAYNSSGQLIGIATSAQFGRRGGAASCQFIDDTNQDGIINNNDHCVPTGDFISTIRPISLAQSLIRGAVLDLSVEVHSVPQQLSPPAGPPAFSRLLFAPSVVDGFPSTVVGSMPANSQSLYLFFDYRNMTSDTVYELRVTRDGIPDPTFSLPPVHWSGGQAGLWHIGSGDQPWANGTYQFTLLINGLAAGTQQIVIGGGAEARSSFSNIVFGLRDNQGNIMGNGFILPVGVTADARFLYSNLEEGMTWSAVWYYRGIEVARSNDIWRKAANGSDIVSLQPRGGLLPGAYRLELYLNGALSATSDFVVAGDPGGPLPAIFDNPRFTSAPAAQMAVASPVSSSFPEAIPNLFARFDWQNIAAGAPWTIRWLVDDLPFYEQTSPWVTLETGSDFLISVANPPDGNYELQLLVNNLQILQAEAIVGIGQLPIDRLAELSGTILSGRVIDAATLDGIASVTIVLIGEDYAAGEFEWIQEQVVDLALTDRNGNFRFSRPLSPDTPYSVVIEADGYLPQTADGFQFTLDQRNADITIELVRG